MRLTGILHNWNDDKGFGFILPSHGGRELFIHISAFPRDGSRPSVGETLTYEAGQGKDGRLQAVRVVRQAIGQQGTFKDRPRSSNSGRRSLAGPIATLVLLSCMGAYGFKQYQAYAHRTQLDSLPSEPVPSANTALPPSDLRCDGRIHCTQMTSCAEATWFIHHCPGTMMDGNHDGVPCEQQWCTGS